MAAAVPRADDDAPGWRSPKRRARYELGPNGAIVTSLNLFATKFDEVLHLIERRSNEVEYGEGGLGPRAACAPDLA